nr:MAG TPA: hypothetical protein [Caudoviricetes sp.]
MYPLSTLVTIQPGFTKYSGLLTLLVLFLFDVQH